MCQIMYLNYENIGEAIVGLNKNKNNMMDTLNIKGGDEFSSLIIIEGKFFILTFDDINYNQEDPLNIPKEISKFLMENIDSIKEESEINLIIFSRQVPEMENQSVKLPPYYNHDTNTYNFIHGTIYNDKELLKRFNSDFNLTVDTEIVSILPFGVKLMDVAEGLYTIFEVSEYGLNIENRGMGIWEYRQAYGANYCFTTTDYIIAKNNIPGSIRNSVEIRFSIKDNHLQKTSFDINYPEKPNTQNNIIENKFNTLKEINTPLFVSYSGGMDITLSLLTYLTNLKNQFEDEKVLSIFDLTLVYFDYNSRATKEEIDTLIKMQDLLKNEFNINAKIKIEKEIEPIVKSFSNIFGKVKLLDKEAKGDIQETEENLSYVPYRNSLFAMTMATYIDRLNYSKANLMFGLNLTEGQVFGDNNSLWVEYITGVINTGGKKYKELSIVSPFINDTKTNMILKSYSILGEDLFNKGMDLSFSCYYPEDNKACGKCGSCILREKALSRVNALKN